MSFRDGVLGERIGVPHAEKYASGTGHPAGQPATTFPTINRCIDRGIRRSKNTVALVKKPGTSVALRRNMAPTPALATRSGWTIIILSSGEIFWPATLTKDVSEAFGQSAV